MGLNVEEMLKMERCLGMNLRVHSMDLNEEMMSGMGSMVQGMYYK